MRLTPIFFALLLVGCALLPPTPLLSVRPAQSELAPFALNGRISINHHGERHSAGIRWTHQAQTDEILLLAPLGQTAARIYSDSAQMTLEQNGKHYQADNAESLMQQALGWYLPLHSLHHWLLGLPGDNSPAQIERDGNGRANVLYQDGWDIHYLSYASARPDSLPKRMQLNHEDLHVLLLIDEWEWVRQ